MTERFHTAALSGSIGRCRTAGTGVGKIALALDKLEAIGDNFSYPMFIAILTVIAADLQAAFNQRALPFGETIAACFCLFTPNNNRDKVGFSLPILIGERSVHRQGELTNNFTGTCVAHFRISSKSA